MNGLASIHLILLSFDDLASLLNTKIIVCSNNCTKIFLIDSYDCVVSVSFEFFVKLRNPCQDTYVMPLYTIDSVASFFSAAVVCVCVCVYSSVCHHSE